MTFWRVVMNKKVLIYEEKSKLANFGGPLGYCYNLKEGLKAINEEVYFLDTLGDKVTMTASLKKIGNKFIRSILKGIRDLGIYLKIFLPFKHSSPVDLNEYDVVHFHDSRVMYGVRNSLKKYKGKVLLTSHSPILPSVELGQGVEKWVRILFFFIFLFEKRIDHYAFKRANYIISPCENAMDSYSKYWKGFKNAVNGKVLYLLTGSQKEDLHFDEAEIKSKYSLHNDMFNVVYLGRHNKVKGYDFLKTVASNIKNEKVRFVVGGNLGPLYPPKLPNWTEIGFTKEALQIMQCADAYISCNTDTYFDLATIQSLSVGTPVITRRIGGNLFFEKNNIPGVFLFDSIAEIEKHISFLEHMSQEQKNQMKKSILESFDKLFNEVVFAKNYVSLINEL